MIAHQFQYYLNILKYFNTSFIPIGYHIILN